MYFRNWARSISFFVATMPAQLHSIEDVMAMGTKSDRATWSNRWLFVLAAAGSAVGLGNIWKFPYIAGENGGGAFVLIYLACVFLVGIPIMVSEVMLGRSGRASPINAMRKLAKLAGRSQKWSIVGGSVCLPVS